VLAVEQSDHIVFGQHRRTLFEELDKWQKVPSSDSQADTPSAGDS